MSKHKQVSSKTLAGRKRKFGEPRVAYHWRRLLSYNSGSLQLSINIAYKDRQLPLHFTVHKVSWHSPFYLQEDIVGVSINTYSISSISPSSIILSVVYQRTISNVLIDTIYN
jgi:hypothetical protein